MAATQSRKRVHTRVALLVALQELLVDPASPTVSVPQVVARAGVAQGTFYNYFDSLPAAIDAVGELLLGEYFRTVLRVIDGADDAAEVVARSNLQTFKLFDRRRDVGQLVFDSGVPIDRVIILKNARPQLMANVQWGIQTGAFTVHNVEAACSIHTGAIMGSCLDVHRGRLSVDDAPDVIASLLRGLGVSEARSRRLADRPQEFEPWRPLPLLPKDEG